MAGGCGYLGTPGNPPAHWEECPPAGARARAREAWPCDTSAGGAASRIYLGNQSEPGASPNPAGDSSASLPVIALRSITRADNENTDIFSFGETRKKHNKQQQEPRAATINTADKNNVQPSRSIVIYFFPDKGIEIGTLILGTPPHQNVAFPQRQ